MFATCSCKVVDRKERKKLMIKHRKKKQYYKAIEPPEKKILLEKKFRDMKNKQEIQKRTVPKIQYWVVSISRTH